MGVADGQARGQSHTRHDGLLQRDRLVFRHAPPRPRPCAGGYRGQDRRDGGLGPDEGRGALRRVADRADTANHTTPKTKRIGGSVTGIANGTIRSQSAVSYRSVVVGLVVLVMLSLVGCWSATAFYRVDKLTSSNVFVTISTTTIVTVLLLPWFNLKGQENLDHEQRMEKMVASWLAVLAVAHLTWEMPWVLFHTYLMGKAGEGQLWSYLWWIYADGGDTRYIHPDGNLLAFEAGASFMGVIAAVLAYLHKKAGRFTDSHLVALIALMACEFYVTVIYILSAAYARMAHVNGAVTLVVKLLYGFFLWFLVPWVVFLWASGVLVSRVAGPH